MKKIVVLFNDRDPVLARVLRSKFNQETDWEIGITNSFEEAMREIEDKAPNVLLTELMINDSNGKTGFDLIEAVRSSAKSKDDPLIIVLTELNQDSDMQKAKEKGANHYFVKSKISVKDLVEEISRLVE